MSESNICFEKGKLELGPESSHSFQIQELQRRLKKARRYKLQRKVRLHEGLVGETSGKTGAQLPVFDMAGAKKTSNVFNFRKARESINGWGNKG